MQEFAERLPSAFFAGYLSNQVVVDATGIGGAYDFTLSFSATRVSPAQAAAVGAAAGQPVAADPDGLTLFDAIEKQLGLKLEQQNLPAPVVILDHVEEKPADN